MTNDSDKPPFTSAVLFSPPGEHHVSSASTSRLESFTGLDMSPQPITRKPFIMMDQQQQQQPSHYVVTPCRSSSSDKGVDSSCMDEGWQNQDRHQHGDCASILSPPPPPPRRHMMPASSSPQAQHDHCPSSPLPFFPYLSDTVEETHYHHHVQHPHVSSLSSPLPSFKLKQRRTTSTAAATGVDGALPFLR